MPTESFFIGRSRGSSVEITDVYDLRVLVRVQAGMSRDVGSSFTVGL